MKSYIQKTKGDDYNPDYMFQTMPSELISAIVNGHIDPIMLAKKELENRGLDNNCKWIGFKK